MSLPCKECGQPLNQHKDGTCDHIERKRYNRRRNYQVKRDIYESHGMVRGKDSSGRTIWE